MHLAGHHDYAGPSSRKLPRQRGNDACRVFMISPHSSPRTRALEEKSMGPDLLDPMLSTIYIFSGAKRTELVLLLERAPCAEH